MNIDSKTFHFNLYSQGRLDGPKRFDIKNISIGYVLHDKTDENWLIQIGDIVLMKENNKQYSGCHRSNDFEYEGNEKSLCGKILYQENYELKGEAFIPERIRVIQMNETEE